MPIHPPAPYRTPFSEMTDGIPPAETWPSYGELRSCQKFCFTACQEGNSSALSHTSHPDQSCKTPSIEFSSGDPQAYRGLIEELKCSEIPCICRYDKWLKSVQKLYDCGAAFCQTGIGTPALPDVDFSQSINVLTGFCSKQGYQHLEEFQLDVGKNYTGMGPR